MRAPMTEHKREATKEEIVAKYNKRLGNLMDLLGNVFGYDIKLDGGKLVLRSKYAFDEEDVISIAVGPGGEVVVESSDFMKRWTQEKSIYLERGKSLGAFLASITLSLFEQSTFQ